MLDSYGGFSYLHKLDESPQTDVAALFLRIEVFSRDNSAYQIPAKIDTGSDYCAIPQAIHSKISPKLKLYRQTRRMKTPDAVSEYYHYCIPNLRLPLVNSRELRKVKTIVVKEGDYFLIGRNLLNNFSLITDGVRFYLFGNESS